MSDPRPSDTRDDYPKFPAAKAAGLIPPTSPPVNAMAVNTLAALVEQLEETNRNLAAIAYELRMKNRTVGL